MMSGCVYGCGDGCGTHTRARALIDCVHEIGRSLVVFIDLTESQSYTWYVLSGVFGV